MKLVLTSIVMFLSMMVNAQESEISNTVIDTTIKVEGHLTCRIGLDWSSYTQIQRAFVDLKTDKVKGTKLKHNHFVNGMLFPNFLQQGEFFPSCEKVENIIASIDEEGRVPVQKRVILKQYLSKQSNGVERKHINEVVKLTFANGLTVQSMKWKEITPGVKDLVNEP